MKSGTTHHHRGKSEVQSALAEMLSPSSFLIHPLSVPLFPHGTSLPGSDARPGRARCTRSGSDCLAARRRIFPVIFVFCISFALGIVSGVRGQTFVLDGVQTPSGTIIMANAGVSPRKAASLTSSENSRLGIFYSGQGAWGRLKCFNIFIEAPKSLVEDFPLPGSKPRWSVSEEFLAKLPELFKSAGLSKKFIGELLEPKNQVREGGMVHLFPRQAELEAMTPAMRATVYRELARFPENEYHADPVLMTTETVREWFHTSKLRPEIIAKIDQMSYRRGECLAFSDLSAIMNYATGEADARAIFKSFTRTRSLMVQMELLPETDLQPLLDYWTIGIGLRRKDIEPLMSSIKDTPGVGWIGLAHIIPALPRKLLYTYPGPELMRHGILPDCHWTSLNFFNYEPHEYLLDSRLATSAVLEKFEMVEAPYRYGDILFFLDADKGDAFHSCVYLADDIVYTKNGRNLLSPWILMKISDVKKIYIHDRNGRVQAFRHKKATGNALDQ